MTFQIITEVDYLPYLTVGTPAAYEVRVFGFRGVTQMSQLLGSQFTDTISQVLLQPYEWSQVVGISSAGPLNQNPVSTALVGVGPQGTGDGATMVLIEVPDGRTIRYEVNTPGRSVAASSNSLSLNGVKLLPWQPGTTISMVDSVITFNTSQIAAQSAASLPNPAISEGQVAVVSDAIITNWGKVVVGGGSHVILAYCDGSNWLVAGI